MKTNLIRTLALASVFFIVSAFAQTPSQITLSTNPPQSVTSVAANLVGNPGNGVYFYWVVANYTGGQAQASPPAGIYNAPSPLSAASYVQVSWQGIAGATSYDVLRTTTLALPNGTCTCAVATGLTTSTTNDTGGALSSYTLNAAPGATFTLALNSVNYSTPTLLFGFPGGLFTMDKNGLAPTGSASGDLSSTYPGPTVAKIQGRAIATTAPTDGQCLAWVASTSKWTPSSSCGGGGTGSVTSVALSLPAEITVSGSPVTTSGTLTGAWATQAANLVFRSGNAGGTPSFTALTTADLPATTVLTSAANTYTAGAKQSFVVSATTAGAKLTPAALPSTPVEGDLAYNSSTHVFSYYNGSAWYTPTNATGTVTSVALTAPAILSVGGSPVTTTGTLALTLANQSANIVFAGPSSGGATTPTFRALVAGDLPSQLVYNNQANTYTAGNKQTFTPSATTAGINVVAAALPSTPATGDIAVDSGNSNNLKWWNGSTWVTIGTASAYSTINNNAGTGQTQQNTIQMVSPLDASNGTGITNLSLAGLTGYGSLNQIIGSTGTGWQYLGFGSGITVASTTVSVDSATVPSYVSAASTPVSCSAYGQLFFNTANSSGLKMFYCNGSTYEQVTGGAGTVTSVALSAPTEFTVSGSPVTTTGTLTFAKANQNANLVYAGPSTGAAAAPTFRSLVAADLPATTVYTGASNQWSSGTTQDWSLIDHSLPAKVGLTAALPATCTVGEIFFATDAANGAGRNLYYCTASNTWTAQPNSVRLSNLSNPSGNTALTMSAFTTTLTYNATTGANDLFKLVDTASNTGTGHLLFVNTAASSTANPAAFEANGNGIVIDNTGKLTKVGTGSIDATALTGAVPVGSLTTMPDAVNQTVANTVGTTDILCANAGDTGCTAHVATSMTAFATTYTIPANYLVANKIVTVWATFMYTSSSSPPLFNLQVNLGSTAVYTSSNAGFNASNNNESSTFIWRFIGSAAAGASVPVYTAMVGVGPNAQHRNFTVQPVNIATNASQIVSILGQFSAGTAGNWIKLIAFTVQLNGM